MNKGKQHQRNPVAETLTQLILETFRFNGLLNSAGDRLTKELGLSSALWQVLGAVREEALPVAQIARNMGLTRQSVRRTANVLKTRGFVEFRENPNHKRAKLVVLTSSGRNVLDQVTDMQITWSNSLAADLDEKKLQNVIETMKILGERL